MPNKKSSLLNWLFKKPLLFAGLTFIISAAIVLGYSLIVSLLNTTTAWPMYILLLMAFIWVVYYVIKKLPDSNMYHGDFVAITNGYSLIIIAISIITMLTTNKDVVLLQRDIMWLYLLHPTMFWIVSTFILAIFLYMAGITVCGIYAKYKRAREIGISKWKIICSMPFAFLLMWTPGYLIADKKNNSALEIKTSWYKSFNKWVLSNSTNVLFAFLIFLLLKNTLAGLPVLGLTFVLLVIYALWNLKYKKDLIKILNNGYALTAVGINIAIIIVLLTHAIL